MSPLPSTAQIGGLAPTTPTERHRAALWVTAQAIARNPDDRDRQIADATTVLRALGLADDPDTVHLHPMYRTPLPKKGGNPA